LSERTRVALLGSTGSIGRQALDVLEAHAERFEVVALAAGRNVETIRGQLARHTAVQLVAMADEGALARLELRAGRRALTGPQALEEMAADDAVDLVLVGASGIISLRPVLAALERGKVVATANKETLVAGGHLVMPLARSLAAGQADAAAGALAWLRPIDSEHSAIWQCLVGRGESPT
jgi:1-deoxy-D-xylulose-5-phosphate reductoisomerase